MGRRMNRNRPTCIRVWAHDWLYARVYAELVIVRHETYARTHVYERICPAVDAVRLRLRMNLQ
jgi:hypothetical protein